MNKELQDLTWSVLPKKFKEEVKKEYARCVAIDADDNPNLPAYAVESAISRRALLEKLFGEHNLTSGAEGEEMLTVEANLVKELYQRAKEIEEESKRIYSPLVAAKYCGVQRAIEDLFGTKCLPDEEPKFKVGELCMRSGDVTRVLEYNPKHEFPYTIHVLRMNLKTIASESDLEPYTEPEERTCTRTCTDDCPSQSRNLSQETANCDKCNDRRLHIAAMAMQGILGNADRMKSYEQIAKSEPYEDLSAVVARNAVRYANALIAECCKDTTAG